MLGRGGPTVRWGHSDCAARWEVGGLHRTQESGSQRPLGPCLPTLQLTARPAKGPSSGPRSAPVTQTHTAEAWPAHLPHSGQGSGERSRSREGRRGRAEIPSGQPSSQADLNPGLPRQAPWLASRRGKSLARPLWSLRGSDDCELTVSFGWTSYQASGLPGRRAVQVANRKRGKHHGTPFPREAGLGRGAPPHIKHSSPPESLDRTQPGAETLPASVLPQGRAEKSWPGRLRAGLASGGKEASTHTSTHVLGQAHTAARAMLPTTGPVT